MREARGWWRGRGRRRISFNENETAKSDAPSTTLRVVPLPRYRGCGIHGSSFPQCPRHCEERSDEAIQRASRSPQPALDCFAPLAMTNSIVIVAPDSSSRCSRFIIPDVLDASFARRGGPRARPTQRSHKAQIGRPQGPPLRFVIARSEATKQSRTASRPSQPALDCFASLAMTNSRCSRAALLTAPRVLPTMFTNGRLKEHDPEKCSRFSDQIMLPQKGGGAPKGAVVDTAGPLTSVAACLCAHGARRFWRTRSPSGALPRLSPKPFGLGSVRSRASWQRQRK